MADMRHVRAEIYEDGRRHEVAGKFHCWGVNFEEFENGAVPFTVAIIELDSGRIVEAVPTKVRFLD